MNINFEKIKKGVSDTATKVKEVSTNVVEITKLKIKLSEIKSQINSLYMQIGKLVYENADAADNEEIIISVCDKIKLLKDEADKIQYSLDDAMCKKTCANCDERFDKNFSFCPKCGMSCNNDD